MERERELFFLLIIFTVGFRDGSETEADTNRRSCRSLSYPNVYFRDASHFMPAEQKLARLGFVPSDDDIVMHIAPSYAVAAPGLRSGTARPAAGRPAADWTGQRGDELCERTDRGMRRLAAGRAP